MLVAVLMLKPIDIYIYIVVCFIVLLVVSLIEILALVHLMGCMISFGG